ncbi:unnamed protein product, partial [Brassica oleracea var. botrytis]
SVVVPATFLRLEHSTQEKRMFLWAEFRDPRFYPNSCESLPSIATIGVIWLLGLTEAARLGTSHAELKDDYFETSAVIFNRFTRLQNVHCTLAGKKWLCMVQL